MAGGGTATEGWIDRSVVPVHVPGVIAVDAEGEAVLVDEVAGRLCILNATAALLWECFDGESPVADICADIADELGTPFELILADTLTVVEGLMAQGALYDRREPPPERAELNAPAPPAPTPDLPRPHRLLEEPPNT